MGTLEIITALTKTFIIILPGYILKRMGILTKEHTQGMSSVITHITYPCLVINAMQMEFSMKVLSNCKYVVLIFLCVIIIAIMLSKLVERIVKLLLTIKAAYVYADFRQYRLHRYSGA